MWKEAEVCTLQERLRIAVEKRSKILRPLVNYVSELQRRNGERSCGVSNCWISLVTQNSQ